MVILVIYVDDMILTGNNKDKIREVKNHLSSVFQMKDLGEPKNFLGIIRDRNSKIITLSKSEYIEKYLDRFNMKDCKPQKTPMATKQVKKRELKDLPENFSEVKQEHPIGKPYVVCSIWLELSHLTLHMQ